MIDCTGLIVAPGFIDGHSHSVQGVTTEVVGNCGFSAYPCAADGCESQRYASGIFRGGDEWGWHTAGGYLPPLLERRGSRT